MAKLLFLSNIQTPYQVDFLDRLAERHDLRAVFLWSREANRDWHLSKRGWLHILDHRSRWKSIPRMAALLHEFKPDAVLIGGYRLPLGDFVKWTGLLQGARVAYWLEQPLPQSGIRAWLRRFVWRLKLPFSYGVAAIGKCAVAAYAPYCRHCVNLPYSIELDRYARRDFSVAGQEGPLRFLFVGQLIHRKGVVEMLEAFSGIPATDAVLTVAGSGELQPVVESYASRFPNIRYRGFVSPEALPALYLEHDVFMAPSRHDGWAVVVCEAMAAGMPIIGTRATGAVEEFIRHEHNGYHCEVASESIRDGALYYIGHRDQVFVHGERNSQLIRESDANAVYAAERLCGWLGLPGAPNKRGMAP